MCELTNLMLHSRLESYERDHLCVRNPGTACRPRPGNGGSKVVSGRAVDMYALVPLHAAILAFSREALCVVLLDA